jgi:hypothetical protein
MLLLKTFCEWVQEFPSSIALRESQYAYPAIEIVHVVSLGLFLGLIVMMDARLAGIGNRHTPFTQMQKRLFPWQMAGFAIQTSTGLLLLYSDPMRFYVNIFWWIKFALLILAGGNAMLFHYTTYHSVAEWDNAKPPFRARLSGILSLVFWGGVVISGRMIAYNWFK